MVSVYTKMNAASLALFLTAEKTRSATTFAMSDEVTFFPPKAMLGVMQSFADDKSLNAQFNETYRQIRDHWRDPVDGTAHIIIQAKALEAVILENREKFPPGEFKFVIATETGYTETFVIPDRAFSAGKIFKKEQARREEDFKAAEAEKEAEKQRGEVRSVTPAEVALQNLLAVASLQAAEGSPADAGDGGKVQARNDPAKAAEQAYRAT